MLTQKISSKTKKTKYNSDMSDSLTELSKQYKGGIREAQAERFKIFLSYEQQQQQIVKQLQPYIYSFLRPGIENGIKLDQVLILLEHFCPIKYEEWNAKDALLQLPNSNKYPRVDNHYNFGYYLKARS